MRIRKTGVGFMVAILLYCALPFVTGLFGYNDCRGPYIYPMNFHIPFHRLGYNFSYGTKPRISSRNIDRGWFYDISNFGGENNR